jgi:hypothetical protein
MASAVSKTTLVAQCQAIIAALQNLSVTEYTLGGKAYAKADLISAFQAYLDAAALTASTKKSQQNAVLAETTQAVSARTLRALLKAFLQSRFGKSSPELTPFTFSPTKAVNKTVAVKAIAVLKSENTRKLLHTMSPKQKKKVIKAAATAAAAAGAAATAPPPAPPPAPVPGPANVAPTAVVRTSASPSAALATAGSRTENGS